MNKKQRLIKGLKILGAALLLLVVTTYVLTFAFINKSVLPIYLLLPLGIIGVATTIYTLFKGIKTVVSALLDP